MKKTLLFQLFIPLLIASSLAFGIAYLFNKTLDYSSIFLNLSTDFIMIIITIWYVDRVLKRHDEEKWKDIDFSIKYKIYTLANAFIVTICSPLGIHDTSLPEYEIFMNKLRSQKSGLNTDYYGDFAKKIVAGLILNSLDHDPLKKHFARERLKQANITAEKCREIHDELKGFKDDANQIIDLYGTRLSAEQLKALMDFQFWIEGDIKSFDGYMARNDWRNWYPLTVTLDFCLKLLEASSLHWTIVPAG